MHMNPARSGRLQRGISLIESMVAIVVMALGILGILGVQMRPLADTQTGVGRAQAIRLIEDLSERMKVNPNALKSINDYVSDWGEDSQDPPTYTTACSSTACTSAALAKDDLQVWKALVKTTLSPADTTLADAATFLVADEALVSTNRRQLGVMISWRENESDAGAATVLAPASTGGANVTCPAGRICHLQYIQVGARCKPDDRAGPANPLIFCPV